MRILPELESYRDRLMDRASSWAEVSRDDLTRDLKRCLEQVSLLENGVERLRERLDARTDEDSAREMHSRRLSVQEQMRDLTAAYAEALRRHLDGLAG